MRPCDGGSLRELFKYFTKLLAKRSHEASSRGVAPATALDVIFCAMKGRRVYQSMGFRVAVEGKQDENAEVGTSGDTLTRKRIGESILWEWLQEP